LDPQNIVAVFFVCFHIFTETKLLVSSLSCCVIFIRDRSYC